MAISWLMNNSFNFIASNLQENTTWYLDSGATHHMTLDLANLNLKAEEYVGTDHIRVGNGSKIPIAHICDL